MPLSIPVVSPKFIRSTILVAVALLLIATFLTFRGDRFDDFAHYNYNTNSQAASLTVDAISTANVDWSRFAYVQYVTNTAYLCNSVMLFEILNRLQSKADRLMMYPSGFSVDSDSDSIESKLLRKARDEYKVKLMPIEVQNRPGSDRKCTGLALSLFLSLCSKKKKKKNIAPKGIRRHSFHTFTDTGILATWSESYTKLLAFNQTQYDRVLSLDSDSTVLQVCPLSAASLASC